jgi:hypothetical protein
MTEENQMALEAAYLAQASKPEMLNFSKRGRDAAGFRIFLRRQIEM